jgi:hypothetical protein
MIRSAIRYFFQKYADVLDLTASTDDKIEAHHTAKTFTYENNLSLSRTKCFTMAINDGEELPDPLPIDEKKKVIPTHEIVYLGDVFNYLGNNDGLIKDRVRRGMKALVCIASLINETNLGMHEISVWMLLYRSLFISTVLFNSETWSKLRESDLKQLHVIQMKMLKRIFQLPTSTPNSFLLLELGILPIEGEVHKRQLMYLHRILLLPEDDPVSQMFENLMMFAENGEDNWWTQVKPLLPKYGLPEDLRIIKQLSKDTFKNMVNKGVEHVSTQNLMSECSTKKKTASLKYQSLAMQGYMKTMFPSQAKMQNIGHKNT